MGNTGACKSASDREFNVRAVEMMTVMTASYRVCLAAMLSLQLRQKETRATTIRKRTKHTTTCRQVSASSSNSTNDF